MTEPYRETEDVRMIAWNLERKDVLVYVGPNMEILGKEVN